MSASTRIRALWSRRGIRRLAYLLVAGAAVGGAVQWTARQSYFTHWLIRELETRVQDETGLTLEILDIDVDLLQGRVRGHHITLGGDLFRADSVSLSVDPWSTLGGRLRLKKLEILRPSIKLDASRLSRLKLKKRDKEKSYWRVDELLVSSGSIELAEKAWGVPDMSAVFSIHGHGPAYNQLELKLDVPECRVSRGQEAQKCRLSLEGTLEDDRVVLAKGRCRLGKSWASLGGLYEFKDAYHAVHAKGELETATLGRLFLPGRELPLGFFSFNGESLGHLDNPKWRLGLEGRGVRMPGQTLDALDLQATASGSPGLVTLHQFECRSRDGQLALDGAWQRKEGTLLHVQGKAIDLHRLVKDSRVEFLQRSMAQVDGHINLPPGDFSLKHLEQLAATLEIQVLRDGERTGKVSVELSEGQCIAKEIDLAFPEVFFNGSAFMRLASMKPIYIAAEGEADTNATQVASVLKAWDIGDDEGGKITPYQMAGSAHVNAKMTWTPGSGLVLNGECDVEEPRWHGAKADWLKSKVEILDDCLWVKDLQLGLGEGRGYGELWLTWADLPAGATQVDMCYGAFRLPIQEGIKAADLDLDLSGVGSGWTRIYGSFGNLQMLGAASAEDGKAYGVQIPAMRTDFSMDINSSRMSLRDLRIGEQPATLGWAEEYPAGQLSLKGSLDMDFQRQSWSGALDGSADSRVLGLPGPHFQAKVVLEPFGKMAAPFGSVLMPEMRLACKGGRMFLGPQSLEDIEATGSFLEGNLKWATRLGGRDGDFLDLSGIQMESTMKAVAHLKLDKETADTAQLARVLSHDACEDVAIQAQGDIELNRNGLSWAWTLSRMDARMPSLQLGLARPGLISGDTEGAKVDLLLRGQGQQGGELLSAGILGALPFWEGPTNLRVAGEAELSRLKPLADQLMELDPYSLLGDLQPTGTARFDLKLGGSLLDPQLFGHLSLVGGSLRVKTYPQSVENLDFTLRFNGREISLPEEDYAWGVMARGDFKAWGRATWSLRGLENYDLRARLEDFELRDLPEGLDVTGTLDATLSGSDAEGGLLKGSLNLGRVVYRADFKLMDILMSEAMGSIPSLGGGPDDPMSRIALDLDLQLQEPWRCDTNFFKVLGDISSDSVFKVKGSLSQPLLHGRMQLLQGGRLTNLLPAGDVVVERGSVTFHEASSITNPVIDIQGRVDVSPYTVNLQLNGNLDRPQLLISSTPGLRQDEIISILMDPSLASNIGTASSTSTDMSKGLGKTASDLFATLFLADIQERVRKTFGLDRVDVSYRPSAGSSESTYTLGKTFTLFNRSLPFVFQQRTTGDVTTRSGRFEMRIGNFVMQLGGSQSGSNSMDPSGELRYSWTTR